MLHQRPHSTMRGWITGKSIPLLIRAGFTLAFVAPATPVLASELPATLGAGMGVQIAEEYVQQPGLDVRLDAAKATGASLLRVDINWPWIETAPGVYDWSEYDALADALRARKLRPIFILHRANAVYSAPIDPDGGADEPPSAAPPVTDQAIAAFSRWAAAAALRYRDLNPIWEIWNEPDMQLFWPPEPQPEKYVALARSTCQAIKKAVPEATAVAPAAAEMPTVWERRKSLFAVVEADAALLACLDAVSTHTHRFGQHPETVSRDYAVLRQNYPLLAAKPLFDTEWGDAVSTDGISELQQAAWLARMFLVNAMEGVRVTNWYGLFDVGSDPNDREHRFGLIREDGSKRPAFAAFRTLVDQIGGMTWRKTLHRFDVADANGATVLLFCDASNACKLAGWTTEDTGAIEIAIDGWRATGAPVDLLGRSLPALPADAPLRLKLTPQVQYVSVQPAG